VRLVDACTAKGVPVLKLGVTGSADPESGAGDHEEALVVDGLFTIPLAEAREAFEGTLPKIFG
jgi:phosphoribosylformylglycinamidine synthase